MDHRSRFLSAVAAVFLTLAIGATRARADLSPPDACTSPGQPCMNAGPQYNSAGTCVAQTCSKQVPASDGGTMTMTYDCNLCQVPDGGTDSHPSSGSSGCAVAAERANGRPVAGPLAAVAGLVLVAARRRRRRGE